MIIVSLTTEIDKPENINKAWPVFQTLQVEADLKRWGQYEYFLYSQLKTHWKNGVAMYKQYGQHELAHNDTWVCAGDHDYDFSPLIQEFKDKPSNVVVFDRFKRGKPEHIHNMLSHQPGPVPGCFVTSYSNFMKLTSIWKWMDSYNNEPELLEVDDTFSLLIRTMWNRNLIYSSHRWHWD